MNKELFKQFFETTKNKILEIRLNELVERNNPDKLEELKHSEDMLMLGLMATKPETQTML